MIYPTECSIPEIARGDKKAFLSEQSKEIEGNNRMGKTTPWAIRLMEFSRPEGVGSLSLR